jgi:hypothetical protein
MAEGGADDAEEADEVAVEEETSIAIVLKLSNVSSVAKSSLFD